LAQYIARRVKQADLAVAITQAQAGVSREECFELLGADKRAGWKRIFMRRRRTGLQHEAAQIKIFIIRVIQFDKLIISIGLRRRGVGQDLGDLRGCQTDISRRQRDRLVLGADPGYARHR